MTDQPETEAGRRRREIETGTTAALANMADFVKHGKATLDADDVANLKAMLSLDIGLLREARALERQRVDEVLRAVRWLVRVWASNVAIEQHSALWEDIEALRHALAVLDASEPNPRAALTATEQETGE